MKYYLDQTSWQPTSQTRLETWSQFDAVSNFPARTVRKLLVKVCIDYAIIYKSKPPRNDPYSNLCAHYIVNQATKSKRKHKIIMCKSTPLSNTSPFNIIHAGNFQSWTKFSKESLALTRSRTSVTIAFWYHDDCCCTPRHEESLIGVRRHDSTITTAPRTKEALNPAQRGTSRDADYQLIIYIQIHRQHKYIEGCHHIQSKTHVGQNIFTFAELLCQNINHKRIGIYDYLHLGFRCCQFFEFDLWLI